MLCRSKSNALSVSKAKPSRNSNADRISHLISAVKISDVYSALTGTKPRRTGTGKSRGPAVWRGGDGLNVSLDDNLGLWHDFTAGEGGGVLDLITTIQGGSRQNALRWLADFSGFPLEDTPLSAEERARWAHEQKELQRDLPKARYWRRAAVLMTEELLAQLKSSFFDPTADNPPESSAELKNLTRMLERFKRIDGAELVEEYRGWMADFPEMTSGMVYAAQTREIAERRALWLYLTPEACTA
jgi:hypothetical protein